jgi:hypothetical protein
MAQWYILDEDSKEITMIKRTMEVTEVIENPDESVTVKLSRIDRASNSNNN